MNNEKKAAGTVGLASLLICVLICAFALWLFFKYGLAVIMPFLIGWGIALLIVPIARRMAGKKKKLVKTFSVILLVVLLTLIIVLVCVAFDRLVYEVQRLIDRIGDESEQIGRLIGGALDFFENVSLRIPFLAHLTESEALSGFRERIDGIVSQMLSDFVSEISSGIPKLLGNIIRGFPALLLFVFVTLIAGFYFCLDLDRIHGGIRSILPSAVTSWLTPMKQKAAETAVRYLRAYVLLLLMTFGELLVGFSILKIDYAFLLAAVIALIDILPVFGVGSVLIPWAAVLLVTGNYYRGIGLLIVYACIATVRQIAEPKIVGGSIGLHPLVTLFSMYTGFRFFGVLGMIIGPAAALAVKGFFDMKKVAEEVKNEP